MNRGRLKLALIFAAFLGPLLAAFAWYYGGGDAAATRATTNHAPLLAPPLALRGFANPAADDGDGAQFAQFAQFDLDALKRRWTVVHLLPESCAAGCRAALYNTRQARLALGRDAPRVRRVFIAAGRAQLASLAAAHPDATRLLRAANGIENQLIPLRRRRNLNPADALLIDPLGNVMLVIPATLDPRLLLKDLKKLLKLSRVG
ncbi:MAG: hypothetical protein OXU71_03575 [Gammaproteobacteria bacterium]|nr:hypothetical protein [Gammaproteobacteria bacterium]